MRIGEALVAEGLLTREQLSLALREHLIHGKHLGTTLIELGFVDEATLGRMLAKITGLRYAPKELFDDIPREVLEAVPAKDALRRRVVPVGLEGRYLHLAVIDPKDAKNLSAATGYTIILHIAPARRILRALEKYYRVPRGLKFGIPVFSRKDTSSPEEKPPTAPAPEAEPQFVARDNLSDETARLLRNLSRRISRAQNHVELGDVLLDCGLEGCERRILFGVTDGVAEVVNTRNVELDAESVNGLRLPVDPQSIFALAGEDSYYRGAIPAGFERRSFYGKLALSVPREILILPIYGEAGLEAVLYGDGGQTGRIDQTGDGYLPMLAMLGLAVRILNLQVELRQT